MEFMEFKEFSQLTFFEIINAHHEAERKRYADLIRKNRKPRPNRKRTRFGLADWMLVSAGTVLVGLYIYIN